MPFENYYFLLDTRRWVLSFDEPSETDPPVWDSGDTRDFGVTFLQRSGSVGVQVVQSVVAARVTISDPATPGTPITSVASSGASNNQFAFLLPMTGFTTFLSGVQDLKAAAIEFLITTASGQNGYRSTVYVAPNQATGSTPPTSATQRYLDSDELAGAYLPKEVPSGTRMIWTDEVTGQRYAVGFANGQFRADLL